MNKRLSNYFIEWQEKSMPYFEIKGTQKLPIKERIKIHIEFYRQIKKGTPIKKAIKLAFKKVGIDNC